MECKLFSRTLSHTAIHTSYTHTNAYIYAHIHTHPQTHTFIHRPKRFEPLLEAKTSPKSGVFSKAQEIFLQGLQCSIASVLQRSASRAAMPQCCLVAFVRPRSSLLISSVESRSLFERSRRCFFASAGMSSRIASISSFRAFGAGQGKAWAACT